MTGKIERGCWKIDLVPVFYRKSCHDHYPELEFWAENSIKHSSGIILRLMIFLNLIVTPVRGVFSGFFQPDGSPPKSCSENCHIFTIIFWVNLHFRDIKRIRILQELCKFNCHFIVIAIMFSV